MDWRFARLAKLLMLWLQHPRSFLHRSSTFLFINIRPGLYVFTVWNVAQKTGPSAWRWGKRMARYIQVSIDAIYKINDRYLIYDFFKQLCGAGGA
jgi:hypothetical protein